MIHFEQVIKEKKKSQIYRNYLLSDLMINQFLSLIKQNAYLISPQFAAARSAPAPLSHFTPLALDWLRLYPPASGTVRFSLEC